MDRSSMSKWILFTGVMAGNLWLPTDAEACLFSWLRRRRAQQTTAYYPATTAVAANACGPAQCQQTVVRYLPQTAYRTVWQPVPVTTYRRTVSVNPVNGLPMTCTQPCTSYTYQARRVPYTTYRPVLATVPVTLTAGYNGCAPTTTGATTVPYYTPSTGTSVAPAPAAPTPGATNWEPVPQTQTIPGASAAPPVSPSSDPADDRPRIDNSNVNDFGSVKRMPSTSPRTTWSSQPSSTAADRYFRPSPTADGSPRAYEPPQQEKSILATPSADPPVDIRPIPKLNDSKSDQNEAPPLLNAPRDRTALIPTRWASSRIDWPERPVSHSAEVTPTKNSQTPQHSRRLEPHRLKTFRSDANENGTWDETGWRSARR